MHFDVKKANQYIPHILLMGLGIGTANYVMHGNLSWVQSSILSLSTCLIIGYSLVLIAVNRPCLTDKIRSGWALYALLALGFMGFGFVATEVEQVIRSFVFSISPYFPFSAGKMYLFNGVIALVLGFSFFRNISHLPAMQEEPPGAAALPDESIDTTEEIDSASPILKLPVRQGEAIVLVGLEAIVYFEAFDNYAFVHGLNGEKRFCDYSLLFLEKRLDGAFIRIHRKYIINTRHVLRIVPYSNARYQVHFTTPEVAPVVSSRGYANAVRSLIKIE